MGHSIQFRKCWRTYLLKSVSLSAQVRGLTKHRRKISNNRGPTYKDQIIRNTTNANAAIHKKTEKNYISDMFTRPNLYP